MAKRKQEPEPEPVKILVDTCVWLELAKEYKDRPVLYVLEHATQYGGRLIVPRIVLDEFERKVKLTDTGKGTSSPFTSTEIDHFWWRRELAYAKELEAKHGKEKLGPHSDFEWGVMTGKVSALRWVMGEEWDETGITKASLSPPQPMRSSRRAVLLDEMTEAKAHIVLAVERLTSVGNSVAFAGDHFRARAAF